MHCDLAHTKYLCSSHLIHLMHESIHSPTTSCNDCEQQQARQHIRYTCVRTYTHRHTQTRTRSRMSTTYHVRTYVCVFIRIDHGEGCKPLPRRLGGIDKGQHATSIPPIARGWWDYVGGGEGGVFGLFAFGLCTYTRGLRSRRT